MLHDPSPTTKTPFKLFQREGTHNWSMRYLAGGWQYKKTLGTADYDQAMHRAYEIWHEQSFRVKQGLSLDSHAFSEVLRSSSKWSRHRPSVTSAAAWTRSLFVSSSGFTEDGLTAFGHGKRVICMDGLDLCEMLDREIPLNLVLQRKVRRAAETGMPFLRVRDLFPS